jgi:hypothetical protein
MVVVYLLLVELAKTRFYRVPHARTPRPLSTHAERLERHIGRRASHFIHFAMQEEGTRREPRAQASRASAVNKPSGQ